VNGNHLGVYAKSIAPIILAQPQTTNRGLGQTVTFSVNAGGTSPLRYQWRFNGTNISSATTNTYTRSNLQLAHFGYYSVLITNAMGFVASFPVALICTNPPVPPVLSRQLAFSNGTVALSITAEMGHVYSVQSSSNLVQWDILADVFNHQNSFEFLDAAPEIQRQRFYRVRWSAP
jgi:hypothetical protein